MAMRRLSVSQGRVCRAGSATTNRTAWRVSRPRDRPQMRISARTAAVHPRPVAESKPPAFDCPRARVTTINRSDEPNPPKADRAKSTPTSAVPASTVAAAHRRSESDRRAARSNASQDRESVVSDADIAGILIGVQKPDNAIRTGRLMRCPGTCSRRFRPFGGRFAVDGGLPPTLFKDRSSRPNIRRRKPT